MCFYLMADAYTTADVDYRWKGGDDQGIEIVSAEMAQFDLTGVKTRTKSQTNSKGELNNRKAVSDQEIERNCHLNNLMVHHDVC